MCLFSLAALTTGVRRLKSLPLADTEEWKGTPLEAVGRSNLVCKVSLARHGDSAAGLREEEVDGRLWGVSANCRCTCTKSGHVRHSPSLSQHGWFPENPGGWEGK